MAEGGTGNVEATPDGRGGRFEDEETDPRTSRPIRGRGDRFEDEETDSRTRRPIRGRGDRFEGEEAETRRAKVLSGLTWLHALRGEVTRPSNRR
jgi:hypothetical protein